MCVWMNEARVYFWKLFDERFSSPITRYASPLECIVRTWLTRKRIRANVVLQSRSIEWRQTAGLYNVISFFFFEAFKMSPFDAAIKRNYGRNILICFNHREIRSLTRGFLRMLLKRIVIEFWNLIWKIQTLFLIIISISRVVIRCICFEFSSCFPERENIFNVEIIEKNKKIIKK